MVTCWAPTKVLDCRSLVLFLAIICWGRMYSLNGFPYPICPASTLPTSLEDLGVKQVTVIWYVSLSVSHLTGMFNSPTLPCFLRK